jgi:hypothetical protein
MMEAEVRREVANQAMREAFVARALSSAIAAHEATLQSRLTPVIQRHTGGVWSSRAASHSRFRVRSLEADTLARVTDDLAHVRLALERRGRELDDQARTERQYADHLDAVLATVPLGGLGSSGFA